MANKNEIILILNDIRSAQNVGSIFRTADAIGVSKIVISGITPSPIDRFGREQKLISKASLGAEKNISWEYEEDLISFLKNKKIEGFRVISLEQSSNSVDYKKIDVPNNVIIVLGNEVDGVSKDVLDLSDIIVEIPMRGKKESLNVSVAAGVCLFRFFDKDSL